MLVLSRKKGERIRVGPDIVITIVRAGSQNVRIGVDAPDDFAIVRLDEETDESETAGAPVLVGAGD